MLSLRLIGLQTVQTVCTSLCKREKKGFAQENWYFHDTLSDIYVNYTFLSFLRASTCLTRKRFSEKPLVAFSNSRVFRLDYYIYA